MASIPKDWNDCVIGDLVRFSGGSQPPKSTFIHQPRDGYIRLIQIRDYKTDKFATYIPENRAQKFCEPDDIMIARYGPPIFQILRGLKGAYNVALIKAIPDETRVYKEYLYYFLQQEELFQLIDSLSQRSSGQTGIEMDALNDYPFPLPPLEEQRKIAEILSTWDEAIALTEALIAALGWRKQALMQVLLTGEVRFQEFEGDWEEVELGEIVKLINGRAFKPDDWKDTGLPIIRIQNLNGSDEFNFYDQDVEDRYYVETGDLLFSWSGSRGTSFGPHIWNGSRGILNQHIFKVEHGENVEKSYLFSAMLKITAELEHGAHGSAGLVHVTKPELERVAIFLPPLTEQERISAVISCADEECNILNRQLDYLRNQKRGLMQQLLTGAVRVREE